MKIMADSFVVLGVEFQNEQGIGRNPHVWTARLGSVEIIVTDAYQGQKGTWIFHCFDMNMRERSLKGAKTREDAAERALQECASRAISLHNAFYDLERGSA